MGEPFAPSPVTRPSKGGRVTAIIPCYNAAKTLRRAIDSVVRQTYPLHEIIVVDDGSSDGSWELIQSLAPRVTGIRQANSGPARARNRAFEQATGDWIAYLDADDEWLPTKIESQIAVLAGDRRLGWCACNLNWIHRHGVEPATLSPSATLTLERAASFDDYWDAFGWGVPVQPSAVIVHRDLLARVGGWDPVILGVDDLDLWCRLSLEAPRLGYVRTPQINYYVDNPASMSNWSNQGEQRLKMLRKAFAIWSDRTDRAQRVRSHLRNLAFRTLIAMSARKQSTVDYRADQFRLSSLERLTVGFVSWLPESLARRVEGPLRDAHRTALRRRHHPSDRLASSLRP